MNPTASCTEPVYTGLGLTSLTQALDGTTVVATTTTTAIIAAVLPLCG